MENARSVSSRGEVQSPTLTPPARSHTAPQNGGRPQPAFDIAGWGPCPPGCPPGTAWPQLPPPPHGWSLRSTWCAFGAEGWGQRKRTVMHGASPSGFDGLRQSGIKTRAIGAGTRRAPNRGVPLSGGHGPRQGGHRGLWLAKSMWPPSLVSSIKRHAPARGTCRGKSGYRRFDHRAFSVPAPCYYLMLDDAA
jgi:hypothetical protein